MHVIRNKKRRMSSMKVLKAFLLSFVFATVSFAAPASKVADVSVTLNKVSLAPGLTPVTHTLTANVTYDFSQVPGCATGETTGCIKQANVYTVSGTTRTLLFSIAAPTGAVTSQVITGTSPASSFAFGNLSLAITVITPDGIESAAIAATVPVPPPAPISCTATIQ
jgi:hypothetical protein